MKADVEFCAINVEVGGEKLNYRPIMNHTCDTKSIGMYTVPATSMGAFKFWCPLS